MILPRRASVAGAGVKLDDMPARAPHGRWNVLFFDIHMKRIEQQPDIGAIDVANHIQALVDGVDEIGFETIQRFEPKFHFVISCDGSCLLQALDSATPLPPALRRLEKLCLTYRRIHWSDDAGGAERSGNFDTLSQIRQSIRATIGVFGAHISIGPKCAA